MQELLLPAMVFGYSGNSMQPDTSLDQIAEKVHPGPAGPLVEGASAGILNPGRRAANRGLLARALIGRDGPPIPKLAGSGGSVPPHSGSRNPAQHQLRSP